VTVIPDKIEPEIGWRSWAIKNDRLVSPVQDDVWAPRQPTVADCEEKRHPHRTASWELKRIGYAAAHGLRDSSADDFYTWSIRIGSTFSASEPARPRTQPPAGYEWVLIYGDPVPHDSPFDSCGCGLYAVREVEPRHIPLSVLPDGAIGKVALWGKVVAGDRGWRAQFAYPVELYVSQAMFRRGLFRDPSRADRLAETYGVPVRKYAESLEICKAYTSKAVAA
jgi:hypothetical protein